MVPIPLILGAAQTLAGFAMKKGQRPAWQIPGAASEALGMARSEAMSTTRPGDAEFRQQLEGSTSGAVNRAQRSSGSGSQILAVGAGANINQNNALLQNSAMNQQYRFSAKRNLQATLDRFGAFQREKFIKDVMEPYQERARTKEMLVGAGLQNIFGTFKSMADSQMQEKYLDAFSGGNNGGMYSSDANMLNGLSGVPVPAKYPALKTRFKFGG